MSSRVRVDLGDDGSYVIGDEKFGKGLMVWLFCEQVRWNGMGSSV